MSIEKITSKILDDAKEQARSITLDAQNRADEIIKQAEAEAEKNLQDAKKRGEEDQKKVISRRQSVADIDSRKLLLMEKQNRLDQCFAAAAEQAANMDEKEYIDFLVSVITETSVHQGEIVLNDRDKKAVGAPLLDALKQADAGSAFTLSDESGAFSGGLMLRDGKVYIDGTIESFVKAAREELAAETANILFREQ